MLVGFELLENPHTPHWFYHGAYLGEHNDRVARLECSKCRAMSWNINRNFSLAQMRYCPKCGSRMHWIDYPDGGKSVTVEPLKQKREP